MTKINNDVDTTTDQQEAEDEKKDVENSADDKERIEMRNSTEYKEMSKIVSEAIQNYLPDIVTKKLSPLVKETLTNMEVERQLANDDRGITNEDKSNFLHDLRNLHKIELGTAQPRYLQGASETGIINTKETVTEKNEGTNLVPKPLYREIARIARDHGHIMRDAFSVPMTTQMQDFPTYTQDLLLGAFTSDDDDDRILQDRPAFGKVSLTIRDWYNLFPISRNLLADTNTRMFDVVLAVMAEGYAARMDKEGFAGTGAPFTGLLADTNIATVSAGAGELSIEDSLDFGKMLEMKDMVPTRARNRGSYYMHQSVWTKLRQEQNARDYLMGPREMAVLQSVEPVGIQPIGYFDGKKVYESEYMPAYSGTDAKNTKYILFADLSRALILGDREEFSVETSTDASYGTAKNSAGRSAFTRHELLIKPTARYALKTYLPKAAVTYKTANA